MIGLGGSLQELKRVSAMVTPCTLGTSAYDRRTHPIVGTGVVTLCVYTYIVLVPCYPLAS